MNCLEFRREALTDPARLTDAAIEHRRTCANCARFFRGIERLDHGVREAFTIAVPEGLAARILLNQSLQRYPRRPTRWYRLGMAASFLVAAVLVAAVLVTTPSSSPVAGDVLAHMDHETHAVHDADGDVDSASVSTVLKAVNGEMRGSFVRVTYASNCLVGDVLAAHLVVEIDGERYTVFLMPDTPAAPGTFGNDRWDGLLSEHDGGTYAVVATHGSVAGAHLADASSRVFDIIGRI